MIPRPPGPPSAPEPDNPSLKLPLDQLIAQRRKKLTALKESGLNPYPYRFERTHTLQSLLEGFQHIAHETESKDVVRTAGRVMTLRDMGKSCFAHLAEGPHRMQIYVKKDVVGEDNYRLFQKDSDIGDILGVEG